MKFFKVLLHEIKYTTLVTLYLFFCFAIVLLLKKLFLAQYNIKFYGLSIAVLGALVVGKVLVILEKTRLVNLFRNRRLYLNVLFKTFLYIFGYFVVTLLERLIHALIDTKNLKLALVAVYESRDMNRFFAIIICLTLTFLVYNIFSELRRYMGRGELSKLFFSPNPTSDKS